MKKIDITCSVESYTSADELSGTDKKLLHSAQDSLQHAYAPYSNYKVGCALLLDDGTVITGNNQENAAYPSGLCAERVAFFHAGAVHPGKRIIAVAITTANHSEEPVAPCGACRQVMVEYELKQQSQIKVLLSHPGNSVFLLHSVSELLPLRFVLRH